MPAAACSTTSRWSSSATRFSASSSPTCSSAQFPQHNEGQKSKLKASIVSAASLARLGESINLGAYLILGRGEEKTGGRRKHALIADCYEALIAAIYLDGGFEPVHGFIRRQFQH